MRRIKIASLCLANFIFHHLAIARACVDTPRLSYAPYLCKATTPTNHKRFVLPSTYKEAKLPNAQHSSTKRCGHSAELYVTSQQTTKHYKHTNRRAKCPTRRQARSWISCFVLIQSEVTHKQGVHLAIPKSILHYQRHEAANSQERMGLKSRPRPN